MIEQGRKGDQPDNDEHNPWEETLNDLAKDFDPLEDLKQELLSRISVHEHDLHFVDTFFTALSDLEEIFRATHVPLDRVKMQDTVVLLMETAGALGGTNPQLADELHKLQEEHVQRVQADQKKQQDENVRATLEYVRFGSIAEEALSRIEAEFPGTFPQHQGLLPEDLRTIIERTIRPYYDPVDRSYQDDPSQGGTKLGRFTDFFWKQDHSAMLKELRGKLTEYYSSKE